MDFQFFIGLYMLEYLFFSLGNGLFSYLRFFMSSYILLFNYGGRYFLKGQFFSYSVRLSELRNISQNVYMMRGFGLSGSFNYIFVDSLFLGDRLVKVFLGFSLRKISFN